MHNYRKKIATMMLVATSVAMTFGFMSSAGDKPLERKTVPSVEVRKENTKEETKAESKKTEEVQQTSMSVPEYESVELIAENVEVYETSDEFFGRAEETVESNVEIVELKESDEEAEDELEIFEANSEETLQIAGEVAGRVQNGLTALLKDKERITGLEEQIRIKAEKAKEEEAKKKAEEEAKKKAEEEAKAKQEEDLRYLASIIYTEAGNQPYTGQVAVGAVVMNRVKSASFPNTIKDVLLQPGQFGPAGTGFFHSVFASRGYTETAMQAAKDAYAGVNPIGNCLYFGCGNYGIKIGDHWFH